VSSLTGRHYIDRPPECQVGAITAPDLSSRSFFCGRVVSRSVPAGRSEAAPRASV